MQDLLNKPDIDILKLKLFIGRYTAKELSGLSDPCYYPKTKRVYFELLNIMKLKDKDVKEFITQNYKGTQAESWKLWADPLTNLLVVIMHTFLVKNEMSSFYTTMVLYMIIQYARLINKQIKYCDIDVFKYTMDNLTKTHLFFREKSISNSLYYLSKEVAEVYKKDILDWNKNRVILFIGVARHRISQSVKSFAESYYAYKKQGISIKTQREESDDDENKYQYKVLQRGQKVIDDVIKKLTVYKAVDRKAFEDAKIQSKIKTSIATLIANGLMDDSNINQIKIVLNLFVKDLSSSSLICGNEYYEYIRKLMGVKRSSSPIYFKSQINVLIVNIIEQMNFTNEYNKYTLQTQFIINSFLAFYLTSILRNTVC